MYCSERNAGQPGAGEKISSTDPGSQKSTASRGGGGFKATVSAGSFVKHCHSHGSFTPDPAARDISVWRQDLGIGSHFTETKTEVRSSFHSGVMKPAHYWPEVHF